MSASRFRRIALALPGAVEGAHQGTADFRLGKRIFATLGYPDEDWGMVILSPEQQSMLVDAEPEIFRPGARRLGQAGQHQCAAGKGRCEDAEERAQAWRINNSRRKPRRNRPGRIRQDEFRQQNVALISQRINSRHHRQLLCL